MSEHSAAVEDLLAVVGERGRQYGSTTDDKANLRTSISFGVDPLTGVLVRMGDKWTRLINLTEDLRAGRPVDPAQLRDQLLDLAGYSLKAMELLDERFGPGGPGFTGGQGQEAEGGREDAVDSTPIGRWVRSVFGGGS